MYSEAGQAAGGRRRWRQVLEWQVELTSNTLLLLCSPKFLQQNAFARNAQEVVTS